MPDEMNNHPMGQLSQNMPPAHGPRGKASIMPWAILLVVILTVLLAAVMFRDRIMPNNNSSNNNNAATETISGYQAVFMTNGQVYFGQLSDVTQQYMTLKDVYYLQLIQPPGLQGSQQQNQQTNTTAAQAQPQLSLRKLGKDELHGPVDLMKINTDQVLFYEDIKEEGAVMKAIRTYQKDPNQGQAPATNTPVAPANNATNSNNSNQ